MEPIIQLYNQVLHAPSFLLIAICINVLGLLIMTIPGVSNRIIPWMAIVVGLVVFPFVAPKDMPIADRLMLGLILGFMSWAAHGLFLAKLAVWFPGVFPAEPSAKTKEPDPPASNPMDRGGSNNQPK